MSKAHRDAGHRAVQVWLPPKTYREMKILCISADITITDWVHALIDDAIAKNKDENGNLILDDDDDW